MNGDDRYQCNSTLLVPIYLQAILERIPMICAIGTCQCERNFPLKTHIQSEILSFILFCSYVCIHSTSKILRATLNDYSTSRYLVLQYIYLIINTQRLLLILNHTCPLERGLWFWFRWIWIIPFPIIFQWGLLVTWTT